VEISFYHTGGLGTPALDGFLNNAIDNELEIRYAKDFWEASCFNPLNKSAAKEIMILIPPKKKTNGLTALYDYAFS
jgi:hypothetical protein